MFRIIADKNNNKVQIAHAGFSNALAKGFRFGAYISGKELVSDLREDMKKPKHGRTYRVYKGIGGTKLKRPRLHKASSESEIPAIITGEFRKSVDFAVRGSKRLEFGSGNEGLAKKYAKALEFGSSKMAARKPIQRTAKKLQNQVNKNLSNSINKEVNKLGFNIRIS